MPDGAKSKSELVQAYLDGNASDAESAEMARRLREEPGFAEELAVQARLAVALEKLGSEQSETELLRQEAGLLASRSGWRRAGLLALAASLLVLAGSLLLWHGKDAASPPPGKTDASVVVYRGGEKVRATGEMELCLDDRVETGAGQEATFAVQGEAARIKIGELSTVVCRKSLAGGNLLEIERGRVAARVDRQNRNKPFVMQTPHVTATVMGTVFGVRVDGDASTVSVDEGEVSIRTGTPDESMVVGPGKYAVIRRGHKASIHGLSEQVFFDGFDDKTLGDFWVDAPFGVRPGLGAKKMNFTAGGSRDVPGTAVATRTVKLEAKPLRVRLGHQQYPNPGAVLRLETLDETGKRLCSVEFVRRNVNEQQSILAVAEVGGKAVGQLSMPWQYGTAIVSPDGEIVVVDERLHERGSQTKLVGRGKTDGKIDTVSFRLSCYWHDGTNALGSRSYVFLPSFSIERLAEMPPSAW